MQSMIDQASTNCQWIQQIAPEFAGCGLNSVRVKNTCILDGLSAVDITAVETGSGDTYTLSYGYGNSIILS